MMKMKRNKHQLEKGDALTDRLFFFLTGHGINVRYIVRLRPTVFFIQCEAESYILKGYNTYEQASKQIIFLQHLQQTGFRLTSYIRSFPSGLQYGCFYGKYWLLFQYIQHIGVFRFDEEQNRRQAAAALDEYHCYAAKLPNQLLSQVPFLEWNAKWQMRTLKFQRYTSLISACIGSEITSELLRWAEFSLAGLNSFDWSSQPYGFIHGDVIEHNFVRGEHTYLIDFDCVSFGPILYDYVKYCYGILPFLNWSFAALTRYKELYPFLFNRAFLLALIFPGDIMREWDYFLELPSFLQEKFRRQLILFTKNNYELRFAFVEKLYNVIT
jgi:hypothetical protein